MSISGLLLFMFISALIWMMGVLMQGQRGGKKSTPTEFKPTPPHWWERDIETFIRKYWVWIVVFLVWLAVAYIVLIYAIAQAAATNAAAFSHIPKPLP